MLDNSTYLDILTMINDMGKEFERKPSVYSDKGEEDLRDHFLMLLEHFDIIPCYLIRRMAKRL